MKTITEQQAIELATAYAAYKCIRIAELETQSELAHALSDIDRLGRAQIDAGIDMVPIEKLTKIKSKLEKLKAA